jgi:hypothetical protein
MLHVEIQRQLQVHDAAGGLGPLSAASGLVRIGTLACVVADDELDLGVFDLASDAPGRIVRLLEGTLPAGPKRRKAAKPDLEALVALPPFAGHAHGALLALGSGSRDTRHRGALLPIGADGGLQAPARPIDLVPLMAPLRKHFADALNIEGAYIVGDTLRLLQRGNKGALVNACITYAWADVAGWLAATGPAPAPVSVTRFELGVLDGVPLGFTDGASLPDGGWVFCAAAEDTTDSYADGACAGSVVGRVNAAGAIVRSERLALACKVEGIAATADGDGIALLLVTDPDDRSEAGLLLSATLHPDT